MSKVIAFVFYTGAHCVSPVESAPQMTIVEQVPCAQPIYATVGNPFKAAQEMNTVSVATTKAVVKKPARKGKKSKRRNRR
jgi:hypothetical protein